MKQSKLIAGLLAAAFAVAGMAGVARAQQYTTTTMVTTAAVSGSGTTDPAPGYAPTTTGIPDFGSFPDLSVGSRGGYVTDLQSILAELGYMAPPPAYGYFGSMTKAAVTSYQRAVSLPATGYFGAPTKTGLSGLVTSLYAKVVANSNASASMGSNPTLSVVGSTNIGQQYPISTNGSSMSTSQLPPRGLTGYWYNGNWYNSIPAAGTTGINGYWVNGVWTPVTYVSESATTTMTTTTTSSNSTYGISTSHVIR